MDKVTEITKEIAQRLLPIRPQDSNKGTFGKVLVIGGCFNYQGAPYLTAISSLKTGAGLVTLASIEAVIKSAASLSPNLTFLPLNNDSQNEKFIGKNAASLILPIIEEYNCIAIGPGLSLVSDTQEFVKNTLEVLNQNINPVIIDADALNAIAALNLLKLPENSVITPHPKELSRLLNKSVEEIQKDRVAAAKEASEKYKCTTVLKGARTIVCTKNCRVFINTTGNSALAKAGSGDVLTGIIAGLAAQGLNFENSAILAVWLHGLCGEYASEKLTQYCVLAQDLIDSIPMAIKKALK